MQAFSRWNPPGGVLGTIVAQTAVRVDSLERERSALEVRARESTPGPPLMDALRGSNVAVIAEVKRRSPSKGVIADRISAPAQAAAYERGGAAAISVLTEPLHFDGATADLEDVRSRVSIPVLKKDFHVEAVQVIEARALGASALLLIARAIAPDRLPELVAVAAAWDIEPLVEVRDEAELERALASGARIIGINNRDLETLRIDPATAERLIPLIPGDRIAVAESGVASRDDVRRFADAGADAVLVGSAVSAATEPEAAVRALTGVPRTARAG
ncbi:MAG TPA: indole-3-glycerol phosphate synthase TrpC [Gemmatimonadaceae bacterium]|nr:indole-3-glycerol phosphate synthase TrpC [Gemmatimonadaceae bacterium]